MDLKEQYDKLLRYCYMKTKDRYLAEDIVQETFLKFWESHSYENTGKEMAYLYTIARNRCVDEFRKRKDLAIDDYPNLAEEIEERVEVSKEDIDIDGALESLPDDLREIVVLRYLNEMSAAVHQCTSGHYDIPGRCATYPRSQIQ